MLTKKCRETSMNSRNILIKDRIMHRFILGTWVRPKRKDVDEPI